MQPEIVMDRKDFERNFAIVAICYIYRLSDNVFPWIIFFTIAISIICSFKKKDIMEKAMTKCQDADHLTEKADITKVQEKDGP